MLGLDDFWALMAEGRDGVIEIPSDRLDLEKFYDARADAPGKFFVRQAGFLQQPLDTFDAEYFGISPREAAYLDPQQRLLMEVAYEAIENAGIPIERITGTNAGVFIGGFMIDGMLTQFSPLGRTNIGPHTAVSSTLTILSNRLSYLLDLHGPSFTLDTACSSSLVAMHQACQAVRHGECDLALVGGVNVIFRPETLIAMCKGGFLARDGRSKSFDARADGYGRGEGAGVVVIKRLSQAQADGDRIHAIIRGSGVNQDGRTDGITVPNGVSQAELVKAVCARNDIDPASVTYVEAHGTGTAIGDPIELSALGAVFGKARTEDQDACLVGSVKANIGHLEAAAGIAAVIKTALCLQRGQIPPVANLQDINPALELDSWNLALPRTLTELPLTPQGNPGWAAINSFGYGGTNASLIMEPAPPSGKKRAVSEGAASNLLLLSARTVDALRALARAYIERIHGLEDQEFGDLCYSSAVRRSSYEYRLAIVADNADEARLALRDYLEGRANADLIEGYAEHHAIEPVYVFTGMGPQWWAMGRELLDREPLFREFAERVDEIFTPLSGWSILDEMRKPEDESRVSRTEIAQPANFVIQAGLVRLLEALGVRPAAMLGHSVGEVSAAYAAGVLTLEEAVQVSHLRSKLQATTAGSGAMLAVGLSADKVAPYLDGYQALVSIGAVNGPATITLAGDETALGEIAERLSDDGIFNRALQVETAYHSPIMDPLLDPLEQGLNGLSPQPAKIPVYSTVTGLPVEADDFGAAYWRRNVRDCVRFADTIDEIINDGHECFLEIGPHPVLGNALRECLLAANIGGVLASTLRRQQPEVRSILRGIAALHVAGCAIDWEIFHSRHDRAFVDLPSYPWQRRTYWSESPAAREDRLGTPKQGGLLGLQMEMPDPAWAASINRNRYSYILDHCVEDSVVLPGAAYCEIGLELAQTATGTGQVRLTDLTFSQALLIDDDDDVELLTRFDPQTRNFSIYSALSSDRGNWTRHAEGRVSLLNPVPGAIVDLAKLGGELSQTVSAADHYAAMAARGLQYGPMFQGVTELRLSADRAQVLAEIRAPKELRLGDEILHPALLDACFQSLIVCLPDDAPPVAFVPVRIDEIVIHQSVGDRFWCHGRLLSYDVQQMTGEISLIAEDGTILAELRGITARALGQAEVGPLPAATVNTLLDRFECEPQSLNDSDALSGGAQSVPILAVMDVEGHGHWLTNRLSSEGHQIQTVEPGEALEKTGPSWTYRADRPEDLAALLADLNEAHIVDLRGLSAGAGDPVGINDTLDALAVIQAIPQDGKRRRLSVVMRHSDEQADIVTPANAGRLGLTRVAANEYADLDIRMIQIDHMQDRAEALMRELLSQSAEDDVVLTGSERLVRRLRPVEASKLADEALACRSSDPLADDEAEVEVIIASKELPPEGETKPVSNVLATVVATGAGVHDLAAGQIVLLRHPGDAPRYLRAPAEAILACPEDTGFSETQSLALLPLTLAIAILRRAGLASGKTLALYAPKHGLLQPLATAARAIGATVALIDPTDPLLAAKSLQQDHPSGVDIVCLGTDDELADTLASMVTPFGTVVRLFANGARPLAEAANRVELKIDPAFLASRADLYLRPALADLTALAAESPIWRMIAELSPAEIELSRYVLEQHDPAARVKAVAASLPAPRIRADGAYLVTGGLGGFGFEIAKWLADKGAGHIVLAGRKGPKTPGAQEMMAELQRRGSGVTALSADIANAQNVSEMFAKIGKLDQPLRGVFHAAGILDDAPVYSLSEDQIVRVMQPKAVGAWHLHQATRNMPIDAFVMISSIAALLGSPGQGAYVAANTFLDSLANHRRKSGLPAISINLGALAEVGMAARHEGVEKHFGRVGVGSLNPAEAIGMLEKIFGWNPVAMAAARMDWALWGGTYAKWAASPRYKHLMPETGQATAAVQNDGFATMSAEERAALVEKVLIDLVSGVLRLPADGIDMNRSLLNMGVDSLMAMELQVGVDRGLGLRVPTLELMKGVSFAALIRNITALFEKAQDSATPSESKAAGPAPKVSAVETAPLDPGELLSRLDGMTPEEIEQTLETYSNLERSA
ncbi:hypothetical protein IT41_12645 [Paracoccus halophilus]|uniref:Uncharacterized protein n=1 Tax=Paracoccus halophilus TaxID=376733 RepID=A0A099F0T2_9RHOB|nr:hypothetical protein IT41_12645 [Paracoccus halophilus]